MKQTLFRVTCDMCGETKDFDVNESDKWRHMVTIRLPQRFQEYSLDLCPKCLERATTIKFVGNDESERDFEWIERNE